MSDDITVRKIEKSACKSFHEIIGKNKLEDENLYVIGISHKDTLIGFLSYYDETEILLLNKIYLLPEFRHRGYGTMLIREFQRWASGSKTDILAKVFHVKSEEAEEILTFLVKNGFGKPVLKNTYFILDFRKVQDTFIKKRFDDKGQIVNDPFQIYNFQQIKKDQHLFQIVNAYSKEFNSFNYLERNKQNVYDSFFINDNDVLGWFCFEVKSDTHIQVDSLFSNPKYRYSILGIRLFKIMFDQCCKVNPNTKTVSFNVDPDKQKLFHAYTLIFHESIIHTVKVWYTYFYIHEN